jgi:hypothetical protein
LEKKKGDHFKTSAPLSPISTIRMSEMREQSDGGNEVTPPPSVLHEPKLQDITHSYFVQVPQPLEIVKGNITPVYLNTGQVRDATPTKSLHRSSHEEETQEVIKEEPKPLGGPIVTALRKVKNQVLEKRDPVRLLNEDLMLATEKAEEQLLNRRPKEKNDFDVYMEELRRSTDSHNKKETILASQLYQRKENSKIISDIGELK